MAGVPDRVVKTTLLIDEHGAVRAVRSVADESSRTEGKLSKLDTGVKKLGGSFKLLAGIGGITGLAYGLDKLVSKTGEVATETEKFASLSGFGATQSLRLSAALKARGIDTERAAKIFGLLGKNIQSAEQQETKYGRSVQKANLPVEISKHATALSVLHKEMAKTLSAPELGKQAKAFQELLGPQGVGALSKLSDEGKFEAIVKAFERMPAGIQKSRIEMQLFGRGGNVLSTVLQAGNLGLTHQLDLVKKFYPTLKGGTQGLQELIERQSESRMAWEGFQFTIGVKLIPAFNKLLAIFTQIIQNIEHGRGVFGTLKNILEGVANVLGIFVGKAHAAEVAIAGLAAYKIASFAGLKSGLNSAFAPLMAAAVAAASINKSLEVKKPSKAPSRGLVSDVGGFLTGGLLGNPATSPINVARAAAEDLSGGHAHHQLSGVHGAVHVHVNVDGRQIGEAILKNPQAARLTAEAVTHYGMKRAARQ